MVKTALTFAMSSFSFNSLDILYMGKLRFTCRSVLHDMSLLLSLRRKLCFLLLSLNIPILETSAVMRYSVIFFLLSRTFFKIDCCRLYLFFIS